NETARNSKGGCVAEDSMRAAAQLACHVVELIQRKGDGENGQSREVVRGRAPDREEEDRQRDCGGQDSLHTRGLLILLGSACRAAIKSVSFHAGDKRFIRGGLDVAVAALALLKVDYGFEQICSAKVGPEFLGHVYLA